jgi:hypothetical protein
LTLENVGSQDQREQSEKDDHTCYRCSFSTVQQDNQRSGYSKSYESGLAAAGQK